VDRRRFNSFKTKIHLLLGVGVRVGFGAEQCTVCFNAISELEVAMRLPELFAIQGMWVIRVEHCQLFHW
jgi:hypothetical protein